MPIKAKTADSAFTTADWATVDATSFLDSASDTASANPTTSWTGATNALTGAITIDGIFVKISSRVASPVGTFSVRVYDVTGAAAVAGTTVTINVSDIPLRTYSSTVGWMFFKFGAPVLLLAATNYRVETTVSTAGEVTLWRYSTTTNNWCRALRTTTVSAPAAGDTLWICAEWTAAATSTARTVTMDSTATTDYGDGLESGYPQLLVGQGATLTWGTTAATNYRLRLSGILQINPGGTMNMGTSGTPCPRDSTMELQFDVVTTNAAYYLSNFGTLNMYGQSRTSGKNVWRTTLTANTIAGASTWNVADDTGWLSGDRVYVSATQRATGEAEMLVLNGNAGASSFTSVANAAFIHHGVGDVVAHLFNFTRNVRIAIGGTTTKFPGGVLTGGTGTTTAVWAGFNASSTASQSASHGVKEGGVASYSNCALFDVGAVTAVNQYGFVSHTAYVGTLTMTDCVFGGQRNITSLGYGVYIVGGITTLAAPNVTFTGCAFADISVSIDQLRMSLPLGTYTNLFFTGTSGAFIIGADTITTPCPPLVVNGLTVQVGGTVQTLGSLTRKTLLRNISLRRAPLTGNLQISTADELEVDGFTIIGCFSVPIQSTGIGRAILRNGVIKGETGYTTATAVQVSGTAIYVLDNVVFGGAGANEPMTTADVLISAGSNGWRERPLFTFINTTFSAATRFTSKTNINAQGICIAYQRENGVTGVHFLEFPFLGYVRYETTTFRTAAPSERLQLGGSLASCASTTSPLSSTPRQFAVRAGYKVQITVYVRKDATYDGAQPRVVCRANSAIGYDSTTTVATMAGGIDAWETLTFTVPSAVAEEDGVLTCWVEVDGTTGNVYVDDWSASEV